MQLKCIACNSRLSFYDYGLKKSEESSEEEDLCSKCRDVVYSSEEIYTHEYQHEYLTENWEDFVKYSE